MHNRSVRGHHDRVFLRFFFFAGISFSLSLSEILCGVRVNGGLMPAIVNHDTVWLFFLCAATVVVMGSPQSSHTRCTHKDLKPFFSRQVIAAGLLFFFTSSSSSSSGSSSSSSSSFFGSYPSVSTNATDGVSFSWIFLLFFIFKKKNVPFSEDSSSVELVSSTNSHRVALKTNRTTRHWGRHQMSPNRKLEPILKLDPFWDGWRTRWRWSSTKLTYLNLT